jgi:hypothetical protein
MADKSVQWLKEISGAKEIQLHDENGNPIFESPIKLSNATTQQLSLLHFHSMKGMLNVTKNKILEDWVNILNYLGKIGQNETIGSLLDLELKLNSDSSITYSIIHQAINEINKSRGLNNKLVFINDVHYVETKSG